MFSGICCHIPIADISETQGRKVVVTTSIAHMFLKSKKSREVTLHNTGVRHLEPGPWKVTALSSFQLTLHVDQMENPFDTSMGTLCVNFPRACLATGLWHCPIVGWCLMFLCATVAIMSQLTWSLDLLLGGVGFLSGFAAFVFRRRLGG